MSLEAEVSEKLMLAFSVFSNPEMSLKEGEIKSLFSVAHGVV
jgi:hypothetical protein